MTIIRKMPMHTVFILCILAGCLLYLSGFDGGFIIDDRTYFIDNDILPNLSPFDPGSILFTPSNYWGEHLPVRDFLYVVQYALFGRSPLGYHVVSFCLYLVILWIIYFATKCLAATKERQDTTSDQLLLVFSVVALFSAFPTHVESVSYISGQKDLLCAIFSLISMILAVRLHEEAAPKAGMVLLLSVCYYTAFLSKNLAVGNIILIPLLLVCRSGLRSLLTVKKVAFWIVLNIPVLLWLLYCIKLSDKFFGYNNQLTQTPLASRLVAAVEIIGAHVRIALFPSNLSFGYPFDAGDTFNLLAGGTIVLLALFLAIKAPRSMESIGLLIFLCFMLPVLQIFSSFSNASVYDRYLFLPSFGLCLCVCSAMRRILPQKLFVAAIVVLVIPFSIFKYGYIATYKDDVAVTKNYYRLFPKWPTASFNLAGSYAETGRIDELEQLLATEPALATPTWVPPYIKGEIEFQRGNVEEAIHLLRSAMILCQTGGYYPFPAYSLAGALLKTGDKEQAKFWLRQVVTARLYNPLEYYRAKKLLESL